MSKVPPPIKTLKKFPADARVLADELKPTLDGIERSRQKALAKIRQGWGKIGLAVLITVVAALAIFFIITSTGNVKQNYILLVLPPIIIGIIYCGITYSRYISGHSQIYRSIYKEKVIGGMANLLHPEIDYTPEHGLSESTFKETGLYNDSIDRYSCEDLFAGKIGKTEIMFSEVHAEEKRRRTDSKGRSQTYWVTIFQGILFISDFNKNFRSWLTIKPDFAESTFGWFGRKIQAFNRNLIRLESPEFEQAFVVYGGDQVEARYILTPDMQERLLKLRAAFGKDIRLSLQNSQLNLTITMSDDWFEPSMNLTAHDTSQMQLFINQMTSIFGIVRHLDLNTRIWSKK